MLYLCRLCLNKSKFCFSLFTGNIIEKVESLTSIKIEKNDKLPQTCCESCMANVYSAYNFQQIVIQSDTTLHELYTEESVDVKVEIEEGDEIYENVEIDSDGDDNECSLSTINEDNVCNDSDITDVVMLEDKDYIYETTDPVENENRLFLNDIELKEEFVGDALNTKEMKENSTESLECSQCNTKFKSKKTLKQHMAKHKVDSCPYCFVVMRRDNLKRHLLIHDDSPEICEICGKVAKNKESLRGHMNYLHKNKSKRKCQYCGKEFVSTSHYNTHVRNVHLGIRNHQCDICGKKFFGNHDLKKHINTTHKRARPYICPYCEKGFSSLYARKTHIRQHTHETPYKCEICSSGFRQKISLVTHMRNKHQITKLLSVSNNGNDENADTTVTSD